MSISANGEVVIKDACILFDLIDLGLLDCFYQLKLVVITTPEVLDEIIDPVQQSAIEQYIKNGQLHIDRSGDLDIILSIADTNPGLSFTDASVLESASRRNAVVLSSDKSLRNETVRRGLTVRGMLWIIEELHLQGIIEVEILCTKLTDYPAINKRAPTAEIQKLLKKYTS